MFKSFETIKTQLAELAPAINAFKSEAVQLRIVELVFSRREEDGRDSGDPGQPKLRKQAKRARKVRKANGNATGADASKETKRRGGGAGPVVTLGELIDGGFFAKHRTLGDIIEHCRTNKAKSFRPDQLSGPLARFVRDERLKRQKNADGQYEYWK